MPLHPHHRRASRTSGPGRGLLALSAALNVLLLILLWQRAAVSRAAPRPKAVDLDSVTAASEPALHRTQPGSARLQVTANPTPWSRLTSTNLEQFAINLQRAGCPAQTLCDLLGPAAERQFDEQRRRPAVAADFWAMGEARRHQRQEEARQRADLLEEKGRLLAMWACAAMPSDELDDLSIRSFIEVVLGFLGPDRQEAIIRWLFAAEARAKEWEARTQGLPLPEELAALRSERDGFLRRLEQLIPDAQREEVGLRLTRLFENDRVADSKTGQALGLNAQEYRELCRIQNSRNNEVLGEVDGFRELLGEERPTRPVAEVESDLLALLGEARYREFRRLEDPAFREATALVGASGLSAEAPDQVHALLESFQSEIPELRRQWDAAREAGRLQLHERREAVRRQLQDLLVGLPEEERQRVVQGWTDEVIRSRWKRP